ncbi:MAG: hypothetical protein LBI10_08925, partial [Deltaproteobacteria bacterium]|nr:hypothetical protein [Deltaproteobacteria bacterium]
MPDPAIIKFAQEVKAKGGRLYVTGGQVRDGLALGTFYPKFRYYRDFDLVAFGLDLPRILAVAENLGSARLIFRNFRGQKFPALVRFRAGSLVFEISPAKSPDNPFGFTPEASLNEDALSRDFTVNAIYADPLAETIIDPLAGLDDLKAQRLTPVSPFSIAQDPLRILRAMALISRRGYTATARLLDQVAKNWPSLKTVAPDRFWPEWARWSKARWPHLGLSFLRTSGALGFYPELTALVGSPQNPRFHPEGDVFNHTFLVVQAMSELKLPDPRRKSLLTFAALLHDVGKPRV